MTARGLPIRQVCIHRLAIPMRQKFSHAAAERHVAEPIVVGVELTNDTIGYGETHPREYVSGESYAQTLQTIRDIFIPLLVDAHPTNFGEAIEFAAGLPLIAPDGQPMTAARAAVELAVLDAYSKAFDRSIACIAGWLDAAWLGQPGSTETARFSGVVSSMSADRVKGSIRKMRIYGLRDFKMKVGDEDDDRRVAAATKAMRRGLASGRLSLRLDANGAWNLDEAAAKLKAWEHLPIACVEQPLGKVNAKEWGELARRTKLPLMADESLVTLDDAEALIVNRGVRYFNIRLSKNGGLLPALRLALLARQHGLTCQMGCMVGETSILSAAERWFLQLTPDVRFAEGNFGRFLLADDVVDRPLRFGYGGRWKPMSGPGLGAEVVPARLERFAIVPVQRLHL